MSTCVYQKQHTNQFQGKSHKTYCGKVSTCVDSNGRELCTHHYNKFNAKIARKAVLTKLEKEEISYAKFLASLTPDHELYHLFKHKLI